MKNKQLNITIFTTNSKLHAYSGITQPKISYLYQMQILLTTALKILQNTDGLTRLVQK